MKILIELPTWLGDATMASPAIENLLRYYENSEITLLGSPISIEILKNHPQVKRTELLVKGYKSIYKNSRRLGRFDAFFSFRSSFRSKYLKILIKSNNKFQFNPKRYLGPHLVQKYNSFINESLNTDFKAGKLKLNLESNSIDSAQLVGINPGASYGESKRWYPKEFAKVAIQLSKSYDVLIFGGDNEKKIANDIEEILVNNGVKNYQNLAGKTSILELANLISSLDLFITGDSGPMHLAANFQIPTISIFGPTKASETSQWMNKSSIILKKNLDCQPCMKRECPLKHHNCMKLINAQEVLKAIDNLKIINIT